MNRDLSKKFEVQPMTREGLPNGDLLQISVPNSTSQNQYNLLVMAFMRSSRMAYPPKESYWAPHLIRGVGRGTGSLFYGVFRGLGGVVYEPYKGARERGFKGMSIGLFKGIGGLIGRPVKGGFDFLAQPIAGALNTPNFIYKQLTKENDPTSVKVTNF